MQVVVYNALAKHRTWLNAAVGVPAKAHDEWSAFASAATGADCAVAVIVDLSAWPGGAELRELRRSCLWTGVVLVTRPDPENAHLLADTADQFVWLDTAQQHLKPAVVQAARGLCIRLDRYISNELPGSEKLKVALLALVHSDPPIREVKDWWRLRDVSFDESLPRKQFAKEFRSGINPLFFLEVVRLFRALDEFPTARSWANLAARAGSTWYEDGTLSPKALEYAAGPLLGKVRAPDDVRRSRGSSNRPSRWEPGGLERPADLDRRALFEALVALLR